MAARPGSRSGSCRTARATQPILIKGGADVRHVQKLLSHAELGSTAIYTRVAIKDLREVMRKRHPREPKPKRRRKQ
jgi:integrase/recombinase XerD